jgi:hypothetical protein
MREGYDPHHLLRKKQRTKPSRSTMDLWIGNACSIEQTCQCMIGYTYPNHVSLSVRQPRSITPAGLKMIDHHTWFPHKFRRPADVYKTHARNILPQAWIKFIVSFSKSRTINDNTWHFLDPVLVLVVYNNTRLVSHAQGDSGYNRGLTSSSKTSAYWRGRPNLHPNRLLSHVCRLMGTTVWPLSQIQWIQPGARRWIRIQKTQFKTNPDPSVRVRNT